MAEPRPNVWYTRKQMAAFQKDNPDFVMQGHVLRLELRGGKPMFKFVHWSQASGGGALVRERDGGARVRNAADGSERYQQLPNRVYTFEDDLEPLTPITKRTPQERLDSLTEKLAPHANQLTDEQVEAMVARSWKRGQPVTAETVRAFAAALLNDAERKSQ